MCRTFSNFNFGNSHRTMIRLWQVDYKVSSTLIAAVDVRVLAVCSCGHPLNC